MSSLRPHPIEGYKRWVEPWVFWAAVQLAATPEVRASTRPGDGPAGEASHGSTWTCPLHSKSLGSGVRGPGPQVWPQRRCWSLRWRARAEWPARTTPRPRRTPVRPRTRRVTAGWSRTPLRCPRTSSRHRRYLPAGAGNRRAGGHRWLLRPRAARHERSRGPGYQWGGLERHDQYDLSGHLRHVRHE
jgi:hypothetical protein